MGIRLRPSTADASRADAKKVTDLVLASGSPRRRELLEGLGLVIEVRPADIDESPLPDEDPVAYVMRLAREKAERVPFFASGLPVLAADTTVDLDGAILAKPDDDDHAAAMLRSLRGRVHSVHTGVAVAHGDESEVIVVTTEVEFATISDATIDWYVRTGEPRGKAGAYAIQGAGGAFILAIRGSVSNVIGLPLAETLLILSRTGVSLPGT